MTLTDYVGSVSCWLACLLIYGLNYSNSTRLAKRLMDPALSWATQPCWLGVRYSNCDSLFCSMRHLWFWAFGQYYIVPGDRESSPWVHCLWLSLVAGFLAWKESMHVRDWCEDPPKRKEMSHCSYLRCTVHIWKRALCVSFWRRQVGDVCVNVLSASP